jgi:hypothetical protein
VVFISTSTALAWNLSVVTSLRKVFHGSCDVSSLSDPTSRCK